MNHTTDSTLLDDLPKMDFWDLLCVKYGEFRKAHKDLPEGGLFLIKFGDVPKAIRAATNAVGARNGYPGDPDCVFVQSRSDRLNLYCGWVK